MATDRRIDLAKGLVRDGRTAEAENLYREVLREQPDAVGALEGLGVLLFQRGQAEEAAVLFGRCVAIDPGSARFHANFGEALRTTRRFDQALLHLRRAAAVDPSDVQAWNSLGLVAFDVGRYGAAEHAYREAIRLRPRFVHAHINLANVLLARGRAPEAAEALREAVRIEPNNAVALMNLGRILSEMGDTSLYAEAEALCRRAVALAPHLPQAVGALSRVLRIQGRADEAADCDRLAIERARSRQVGQVAERSDAVGAAPGDRADAPRASRTQPSDVQAHYSHALAHLADNRLDRAEPSLREALRLDPVHAASWVALAGLQAELGDFELSCQSARKALEVHPEQAEAYWRLARTLMGRLSDDDVEAIERLLLNQSLSNDDRAVLHFGLASVLDRRGLHAEAAAHYETANHHQSAGKAVRGVPHDPDQHSQFIDQLIASFNHDFIAPRSSWGSADRRPVFVVGFARSGTTLTEQVLASHPQIHGAGELHDLHRIFSSLPEIVGRESGDPFDALNLLTGDTALVAARQYLDRLDALAPATAARVVDKMPDNVNYVGLIAMLFPRANIIVCRRDPRDVALSCWQSGIRACPWSNDWDHIARRLADYQRVLAHWREVQPMPWLEIQYEDMVANFERNARRLIDFVGLEWHPACLEFHSNRRTVRTPSYAQVRQPINSGSVGRWRRYEESLEPLFRAFDRYGVKVGHSAEEP
jgi:tetratricopeptide (TPR) repeat protein